MLPPSLLTLLYERFAAANPSGTVKLSCYEEGEDIALERFSAEELDRMYDEGTAMVSINQHHDTRGYALLKPYLPELNDPAVIERLAADPWLDDALLWRAQQLGVYGGGIPKDLWRDRSARWSPESRAFCDKRLAAGQGRSFDPPGAWRAT